VYLLQTASIGRQSFVQRDSETFGILPIRNTRRYFPFLVFFGGYLQIIESEKLCKDEKSTGTSIQEIVGS
jgi:hypothetical protein